MTRNGHEEEESSGETSKAERECVPPIRKSNRNLGQPPFGLSQCSGPAIHVLVHYQALPTLQKRRKLIKKSVLWSGAVRTECGRHLKTIIRVSEYDVAVGERSVGTSHPGFPFGQSEAS